MYDIEDYLIRVVEFLSTHGIYPFFDQTPQENLRTILKGPKMDIFKNYMTFSIDNNVKNNRFDIQFKKK